MCLVCLSVYSGMFCFGMTVQFSVSDEPLLSFFLNLFLVVIDFFFTGKKINLSLSEMAQFFMKMAEAVKAKKLQPGEFMGLMSVCCFVSC